MFIAQNYVYCHAIDSPPLKAFPPDYSQQNDQSPWTKYRSHTWSPLCVEMKLSSPLEAVRRDKTMAPCTSVHSLVWTQATKIRFSYRWSRTAKTQRTITIKRWKLHCYFYLTRRLIQLATPRATSVNSLGTSIMHNWPPSRIRETPVYTSSLHS